MTTVIHSAAVFELASALSLSLRGQLQVPYARHTWMTLIDWDR